ncbi:FkbM family methyltransferase [Gaetbulibacter aestuarii]|uniref:FkbM family methyltransferase n=1 Tax=Gaetbulibacter aestuarii TaxID=1502358 RepID=A0ABW7N1Y8_9FLAO
MIKPLHSFLKKILVKFNFTFSLKIDNIKYKVPVIHGLGISHRNLNDPWMLELLKIIHPIAGHKMIDVGANIGQTLLKMKSIDPKIKYIGFEPNPGCIFYLHQLIKTNKIENTQIVPVAVSDQTQLESLHFYNDSADDASATIIPDYRQNNMFHQELVPAFHVNVLREHIDFKEMSILKIDVEGSELQVIKSFEKEIASYLPIIIIEILPVYDEKKEVKRYKNQKEVQSIIQNLEYSMFRIIKSNGKLSGVLEIQAIGIHSDIDACDYIFIPKTKVQSFQGLVTLI